MPKGNVAVQKSGSEVLAATGLFGKGAKVIQFRRVGFQVKKLRSVAYRVDVFVPPVEEHCQSCVSWTTP